MMCFRSPTSPLARAVPRTRCGEWRLGWIALTLGVLAVLSGCAGIRTVDPTVTSHTQWTSLEATPVIQAGDTFAFDRLPSQAHATPTIDLAPLETLTTHALAPLGLQPAASDAAPQWLVQVHARTQRIVATHSPSGWFPQHQVMISSGGGFVWSPMLIYQAPSYHTQYQLSLLLRPAPQGAIVFESQAVFEGPAPKPDVLWKALLDAALRDFPHPPQGPRRIVIDLPAPSP